MSLSLVTKGILGGVAAAAGEGAGTTNVIYLGSCKYKRHWPQAVCMKKLPSSSTKLKCGRTTRRPQRIIVT
jgi:hypothetical protein